MNTLVILQSGFVGLQSGSFDLPTPPTTEEKLLDIKYGNTRIDDSKQFYSHCGITELYKEFRENEKIIRTMDFRERVLTEAKNCFKCTTFLQWVLLQENSSYLTEIHKRFLNETFNFLLTGHRSIGIATWDSLLEGRYSTNACVTGTVDVVKYFGLDSPKRLGNNECLPNSVLDILVLWATREAGFVDLLTFCNIVFGANTQVHVGNKRVK